MFAGTIHFNGVKFLCDGHFVGLMPQSCVAQQQQQQLDELAEVEVDKKILVHRSDDFGFYCLDLKFVLTIPDAISLHTSNFRKNYNMFTTIIITFIISSSPSLQV